MSKEFFYKTVPSIIIVILSGLIVFSFIWAWTEPSSSPPDGNVVAPINTSNSPQMKRGSLSVNASSTYQNGLLVYGRVGIGITDPGVKLDVSGQIHATQDICTDAGGGVCLSTASTGGESYWEVSGDPFNVGDIRNVNYSSFNVGIGVNDPEYKLDVGRTVRIRDFSTAGGVNLLIGDDSFLTDIDVANFLGLYGNQNITKAGLKLGSNGNYIFGDNGVIGIGTVSFSATDLYKLQIEGGVLSNGSIKAEEDLLAGGDIIVNNDINFSNPTRTAIISAPADISFKTAFTERLIIQEGGNVGIGIVNPYRRLDISDVSNPQLRLTHTDGSIYGEFQIDSSGNLSMFTSGGNILVSDDAFKVCAGGSCPSFVLSEKGNLQTEGDIEVYGSDVYIGHNGGGDSDIHLYDDNSDTWRTLRWDDSSNALYIENNNGSLYKIWNTGNDGSGSGLDADTIDGLDSSDLLGSGSAGGIKHFYLTQSTYQGDHNCDDVPSNCCVSGYHMCGTRAYDFRPDNLWIVEMSGANRRTNPFDIEGWSESGASNCKDWTVNYFTGPDGTHYEGHYTKLNTTLYKDGVWSYKNSTMCKLYMSVWCCEN